MILQLFRRSVPNRTIHALYGAIVAQARSPAFYADYGVPDTVQGRFDLIVLHLIMVLHRIGQQSIGGRDMGQQLFDVFCRDLDDNLREMGVGDLAVPKEMRHFAEAFYGRQAVYLAAFTVPGRDFENALARNIFRVAEIDGRAARLARYARAALTELNSQEDGALRRGAVVFPSPEAFADAQA